MELYWLFRKDRITAMKDTGKQVWVPLQLFPLCQHSMCWWQIHVFLVSYKTMIFLFLNTMNSLRISCTIFWLYSPILSPSLLTLCPFLNNPLSLRILNNPSCASCTRLPVGPPTGVHWSVLDLLGTSLSLLEKPSTAHSFSPRVGGLRTPSLSVLECWWRDLVWVVCRQPQQLWAYESRSPCPENTALLWFFLTSGAFSLSVPCSALVLEPSQGGCAIDAPFVAGNSSDTYSLHFDQLWIPA